MRCIGHLDNEGQASTFGDYLYVQGIRNQVDGGDDGRWAVWVYADSDLDEARRLLQLFQSKPEQLDAAEVAAAAREQRREEEKEEMAARQRMKGPAELFRSSWGRVTVVLIGVCVVVSLLSRFDPTTPVARALTISNYVAVKGAPWWKGLLEIRQGQVWRLVTPIFLHWGIIHLLFNMLWLRDLGGMTERVNGARWLILIVTSIAVVSNLAQVAVSGPGFGGMSGVVYGLLGYIWMKGKHDPGCGLGLHPSIVTMMLAWYFICLFGFMPIANTVHTVGLAMGIVWGYASARFGARR